MLGLRLALLRSGRRPPLASRGFLPFANDIRPATASRGFATHTSGQKTPSKWPKWLLIVAAGLYLFREAPERKEQKRLLALGSMNIQKGDFDLATKYYSESFEAIKDVLSPIATIHQACEYATRWEILDRHEAALPYYQTAMKSLKDVEPISNRCIEGVKLMDRMAQCYHRVGRHETAEKLFKKAIRLYEKYHGEFAVSNASNANGRVAAILEGEIVNLLLHYAQLLASMKRDNDIADVRQRFIDIVRDSPLLRSLETTLLEKFDDWMALHDIREKRRRARDGKGHDM
ncbi:hypothetical protein F441_04631 [Phytophthora nicotianae CJ01A1]|uniref:TPR-like protein n=5 Tax=Phytophthora nicotianae TaxID=4792 RepID=V9E0F4_PHYNI|nr:hypothetical protein F443_21311 [Phytophthora nicotianae P1569]ETK92007.1 hypothetical protein L915_04529 [Phytophthora nicotianae]ETO60466.1 hypothetical protein F444_21329 [Phytophthora nicotianae P1976]ETP21964.1 hypothetical protein F441_04631 [Phytophthora nicotianae CJ01A1]ETP29738.1 hypothetical protein F442_21147 [Phytophthora nicotianae P10297]